MKHLQSTISHIALAMMLLVLLAGTTFGQGQLFTNSTWGVEDFGLQESASFERAWNNQMYSSYRLIDIPALDQVMVDRKVMIDAGNECGAVAFYASKVEYLSEDDYFIVATYDNPAMRTECNKGRLTLRSQNGKKFGVLHIAGDVYLIEDLGGGKKHHPEAASFPKCSSRTAFC